jgi:Meckel syndrome type 1 protein
MQAAPAAQTAHPAAFAVTSLVLEREAAVPAPVQPPAAPDQAAPATAPQNAARAQPSTLAALTGAPAPERPAARKLRAEAELALSTARSAVLPAPETAGALAQAQPSIAPAPTPGSSAPSAPQPISFDQLVDSIARARDGLEPAGPVSVAVRHAEFGRIALRIEGDAAGLSVAMASPDPAFAPAVAAAHAAAITAELTRPAPAEPRAAAQGQPLTQGQSQGQSQSQNQSGPGHHRQSGPAPAAQRAAANLARSGAPGAEHRGGIFA